MLRVLLMSARDRYLSGLRRRARRAMWLDRHEDDVLAVLWSASMVGIVWLGLR